MPSGIKYTLGIFYLLWDAVYLKAPPKRDPRLQKKSTLISQLMEITYLPT